MFCDRCGSQNPEGSRFCNNCAYPLVSSEDQGHERQQNHSQAPTQQYQQDHFQDRSQGYVQNPSQNLSQDLVGQDDPYIYSPEYSPEDFFESRYHVDPYQPASPYPEESFSPEVEVPSFDAYMRQNLEGEQLSRKAAKKLANAQQSIQTPPRNHRKRTPSQYVADANSDNAASGMLKTPERKAGFKLALGIIVVAAFSVIIIAIASINLFASIDNAANGQLDGIDANAQKGDSGWSDADKSIFDQMYSEMFGDDLDSDSGSGTNSGYAGHFSGMANPGAITQAEREATFGDIAKLGGFETKEALANFAAGQFKRMFTIVDGQIDSEAAIQELYTQAPPYAIKVLTGGSDSSINELMNLTLESMGYDNAYMLENLHGVETQSRPAPTYALSTLEIQAINNTFKICNLGYEVSSGCYIGVDLTMVSATDTGTFKAGIPQYFTMSNTGFYGIEIGGRWFIWNAVLS